MVQGLKSYYIDDGDGYNISNLEMKCVGDNNKMLMTVLVILVTNIHKSSPTFSHQDHCHRTAVIAIRTKMNNQRSSKFKPCLSVFISMFLKRTWFVQFIQKSSRVPKYENNDAYGNIVLKRSSIFKHIQANFILDSVKIHHLKWNSSLLEKTISSHHIAVITIILCMIGVNFCSIISSMFAWSRFLIKIL